MLKNKKNVIKYILGILFLLVSSYYIYNSNYVETVKYNTVIEIYKNENDYRVYLQNETNKNLIGYNLSRTIGLNINEEEIKDLVLNTADNNLNGIIIQYKSDYYSYYNIENEKNLFQELKLKFANWNRNYIATTSGLEGQFGSYYDAIYNINNEKKIIGNLTKLGESVLYFLKNNDKNYFYIESRTCEQINTLCNKISLYNDNGELIYQTNNQTGYIVDFKSIPTKMNTTYEVTGYYAINNNTIKKYDFNNVEIKSDLYDELLFVGMFNYVDYNLVYREIDNTVYLISNDDNTMKKVTEKKANDYCIVKNNSNLHIYENSCNNVNSENSYYNFNIKNNKIELVILENGDIKE